MKALTLKVLLSHPAHFIGFGFGTGLAPRLPGTVGSLLAVFLYIPLSALNPSTYLIVLLIASLIGIWSAGICEKTLGAKDPGSIVIDEIVGILIALALLPLEWAWLLTGFIIFRILDIKKPLFIGWAERTFNGGLGIMLDDILAGITTFLIVQALIIAQRILLV